MTPPPVGQCVCQSVAMNESREPVWERMDVSAWRVDRIEAGGSNKVTWLEHPDDGSRWLHKHVHVPKNGVAQGEDWAEVVATQVATRLGVPCAVTRLCSRNGKNGSLSRSVVTDGVDLYDGGVALDDANVPGYFRHTESQVAVDPDRPTVERPGHNLANIARALEGASAPPGFAGPAELTAFDVFAGFTILDALVANRDRHEQNWAVLRPRLSDQPERLAPSFDHGRSLGCNLRDPTREKKLAEDTVAKWAEKGTAWRFEYVKGSPIPSLVDHASQAIELCTPPAVEWWRDRLDNLDLEPVVNVLRAGGVPGMSVSAGRFVCRLLECNARRLRDAICCSS